MPFEREVGKSVLRVLVVGGWVLLSQQEIVMVRAMGCEPPAPLLGALHQLFVLPVGCVASRCVVGCCRGAVVVLLVVGARANVNTEMVNCVERKVPLAEGNKGSVVRSHTMQRSSRCCVGSAVYGKSGRQSTKFEVGNAQARCGNKGGVVTTVVSKHSGGLRG